MNKLTTIFLISLIFSLLITNQTTANSIIVPEAPPSFEVINRNSGLSNLSVSSIVQDRYGFLWLGTQGGLNYYDGRDITVFRNSPFQDNGLVHNLIQTMYYDQRQHELWIGTYQGVSRLLIEEKKFENYTVDDNNLSNPVVVAITIGPNENVWIGTLAGLNKLNPKTGVIKQYAVPGSVVRDLKIDSQGRLLIGSYQGLLYYDQQTDQVKKFQLQLPSPYVMTINEFKAGELTLGLWNGGVAKVDVATQKVTTKSFKDNRIYSVLQTDDGTEWMGVWGGGLYAVTSDGKKHHFAGKGQDQMLPHPVVYSLFQDQSDILWIGTNGGGVCKVNPRRRNYVQFSHNPEDSNSLSAGKINSILRDSKGNLWVAVYNAGINLYNPKLDKMIKYSADAESASGLPHNSVTDMLETKDGRILLATGIGVAAYDYASRQFSKLNILPGKPIVYSLAQDNADGGLWLGTYRQGVYYYNPAEEKLRQYQKSNPGQYFLSDNLVYDILVDSKQRVWVATNNGLNLLQPETEKFKVYRKTDGDRSQLAANAVRVLFEDSQGRIWIGMVGGGVALYQEKTDTFRHFIESNGLSSNIVTGILEGEGGRIWVATHNGISIIDPTSSQIYILTPDDGIGGWEFNTGCFHDHNGSLLFSGVHGITEIPADFTNKNRKAPPVYITNVNLFQDSIDPDRSFFNQAQLDFGYQDAFLGFEFAALDYAAPKKVTFAHKLVGFDEEWIEIGTRNYASYSNLPPGDYQLRVVAETARGVKSAPASLQFTIAKPWFKTKLAYFSYGIIFLLFILALVKIREWYLLNQKNSELAAVNEKLKTANQELEKFSQQDALTGLFNRRYFNVMMEELLNLARRSRAYLTLIMLDVDKFKSVNDQFGHLAGDHYLVNISQVIEENLPRSTDFAARYGGDEFVIVLYDTDGAGAQLVARAVREAVNNISINSEFSFSAEIQTTVSMGLISIIPDRNVTSKQLIRAADEALYQAKQQGRNRICVGELTLDQQE